MLSAQAEAASGKRNVMWIITVFRGTVEAPAFSLCVTGAILWCSEGDALKRYISVVNNTQIVSLNSFQAGSCLQSADDSASDFRYSM